MWLFAEGEGEGPLWANGHSWQLCPLQQHQTQCRGTVPQGPLHQVDHAVQALLLGQDHPGEEVKRGQIFPGHCW